MLVTQEQDNTVAYSNISTTVTGQRYKYNDISNTVTW